MKRTHVQAQLDDVVVSEDDKRDHAGKTLVFFDLGNRKGVHFAPKIFYQMPTKIYDILLGALDHNDDEDDIFFRSGDMKCPISKDNIKLAASFDKDPARYMQVYSLFTETLQQELKTYGLKIKIC